MRFNKDFKMKTTLIVFLVLSITLTGNVGNRPFLAYKAAEPLKLELYDTQARNLELLEEIEHKLEVYELTPKDMEYSKSK